MSNTYVSYDLSTSPNFKQPSTSIRSGVAIPMRDYHKSLKEKGITQSMSRKGNCLDNSIIENFFGVMKKEMFYGHQHEFITVKDLEQAMEEYIEYYNTQRIKVKLKGLTPTGKNP